MSSNHDSEPDFLMPPDLPLLEPDGAADELPDWLTMGAPDLPQPEDLPPEFAAAEPPSPAEHDALPDDTPSATADISTQPIEDVLKEAALQRKTWSTAPAPTLVDIAGAQATGLVPQTVTFARTEAAGIELLGVRDEALRVAAPQSGTPSARTVEVALQEGEAGEPVVYGMVARNTRSKPLYACRVEHALPEHLVLLSAQPAHEVQGNKLIFHLGDLAPSAARQIRVETRPARPDAPPAKSASFQVLYFATPHSLKPHLTVTIQAPATALLDELIPLQVEVSNLGHGPAGDVLVRSQPSAGPHELTQAVLEARLGVLAPGQVCTLLVRTPALGLGRLLQEVSVRDGAAVHATALAAVQVAGAELRLEGQGPERACLGEEFEVGFAVSNPGAGPARRVVLSEVLPEELELVSASDGGHFDPASRRLTWELDTLAAGEKRPLALRLKVVLPGLTTLRLLAHAERGLQASAEVVLRAEFVATAAPPLLDRLLSEIDAETSGAAALLARAEVEPTRRRARGGERQVLFTLDGGTYALPAANVMEVGRLLPLTAVPNVPDWVLGVGNVRGDIVAMIDLRLFLGLEARAPGRDGRLLVVKSLQEDMTTALVVDEVRGIRAVPPGVFQADAALADERVGPYLRGVGEVDGRLVVGLDPERLLLCAAMQQFEPV